MKKILYPILGIELFLSVFSCRSSNNTPGNIDGVNFDKNFTFYQSVNIPATDSTIISVAITGFSDDSSITVASGVKPPIVRLNYKDGKIYSYNAFGSGPFELNSVFQVNRGISGEIYALDASQNKILVLNNALKPLREFKVEFRSFKLFTTDNDGNIYGLFYKREDTNAVIKYDKQGNLIKKWGKFNPRRIFQETTNGGGIVCDGSYIYYSYLGGHEIWKYDFEGNLIKVFDQEPDYFIKIDYNKLTKLSRKQMFELFFNTCHMYALFYLEPGYIIQEFTIFAADEDDSKAYLEIWDTDGNKIMSNVEVQKSRILTSFKSSLVVVDDSNIPKGGNPLFEVYKFNSGSISDK